MAELRVPAAVLLLPLLALGAFAGYRRAWARETITGLGLAIVLIAFEGFHSLVKASLRLGARFVAAVADAADVSGPPLERSLNRIPPGLVALACVVVFIFTAYWLGNALGSADGKTRLHRALGALLGALNVVLVLAIVASQAQAILGRARMRQLFLVPGSSRGVDVAVSPLPGSSVLVQWSVYVLVILVLIVFGWGISRAPRLRG